MRIAVLSDGQALDERPRTFITKAMRDILLRKNAAEFISHSKIRLKPIRQFLANQQRQVLIVPQILPPRPPFGLLIHYPIRDLTTSKHERTRLTAKTRLTLSCKANHESGIQ